MIMMFIIWKETDTLINHQVPADLVPKGSNSDPGSQAPHPIPSVMSRGLGGGGE